MERRNKDLHQIVTSIWTEDDTFRRFINSNLACEDPNPKGIPDLHSKILERLQANGKDYNNFSLDDMKKDSFGKDVLQKLGNYQNDQDSDEEDLSGRIEYTEANFICPISRKKFQEPVKSQKCNHYYEKKCIYDLLKKSRNSKCPVPGCRHDVRSGDLEVDPKFLRLMKRFFQKKAVEKSHLAVQNLDTETVDVHAHSGNDDEDEVDIIH